MDRYGLEMADGYETYHGRMSVHEAVIRDMYRKVLSEEDTSPEDETTEDEIVEEERKELAAPYGDSDVVEIKKRKPADK